MLIRIVKMSFKENNTPLFLANFNKNKSKIRNFSGCRLLELYRDTDNPNIFFSYSYWDNEACLQDYRNSDFFKKVWNTTKVLFKEKPEAWSVQKMDSLT